MASTRNSSARGGAPEPAPASRPSKGNGRQYVYEMLKRQIVSLQRQPGAELDEAQLVAEFGISRTPLREAFVKLAGEGLVVLLPNRGARVAPMDLAHTQEHLEAFDLLQRIVTSWAAARRSDQQLALIKERAAEFDVAFRERDPGAMIERNFAFHEAIGLACGNRNLAKFYIGLLSENLRIARLAMAYECYGSAEAYEGHIGVIAREHREIVEAIEAQDVRRAERLAGSHSGLARKRVIEYLSSSLVDDAAGRLIASAA